MFRSPEKPWAGLQAMEWRALAARAQREGLTPSVEKPVEPPEPRHWAGMTLWGWGVAGEAWEALTELEEGKAYMLAVKGPAGRLAWLCPWDRRADLFAYVARREKVGRQERQRTSALGALMFERAVALGVAEKQESYCAMGGAVLRYPHERERTSWGGAQRRPDKGRDDGRAGGGGGGVQRPVSPRH